MRFRMRAAIPGMVVASTLVARAAAAFEAQHGLRERILTATADPNAAFALLVAGAVGVYAECVRPGRVVPGVGGGVFFLLGLSQMRFLPINWWGAASIGLAFALFALQVRLGAWRGVPGITGAAALVWGAHTLVAAGGGEPRIYWSTALGLGLPFSAITLYLMTIAVRAWRNKRETTI